MASKPSSSDVYAPNFLPEPTPDEALTTSFILSFGGCQPQGTDDLYLRRKYHDALCLYS